MGMMQGSGLAEVIAGAYVKFATPESFNVLTFYTSGLLNLFIPSGGGQWAVQAPVAIKAAQELGVDIAKTAMAVAWGDAWTNMIQPFWALPLLAIAGLKLRDIMGYCVMALFVSGVVLSAIFLIF
jgi:short-chain fatty acids transporter